MRYFINIMIVAVVSNIYHFFIDAEKPLFDVIQIVMLFAILYEVSSNKTVNRIKRLRKGANMSPRLSKLQEEIQKRDLKNRNINLN